MSGYLKTYFVMYDDVMSIELGSQPQHQRPRDEPNLAVPTKRHQDFESSSPHLTEVPRIQSARSSNQTNMLPTLKRCKNPKDQKQDH